MGFIDPLTPAQQRGGFLPFPFIFNVVRAVGKNCPNVPDDVKMVHYLLIKFYDRAPTFVDVKKPKGEINFNSGAYSAATENWITKCQIDMNFTLGVPVAMDKRIDRIRNKDTVQGSLTKMDYTLYWLNSLLQRFDSLNFLALPSFVPVVTGQVPPSSFDVVR